MILVVGYFLGVDVTPLLNGAAGQLDIQSGNGEITQAHERAAEFVAVTPGDIEEIRAEVFWPPSWRYL